MNDFVDEHFRQVIVPNLKWNQNIIEMHKWKQIVLFSEMAWLGSDKGLGDQQNEAPTMWQ